MPVGKYVYKPVAGLWKSGGQVGITCFPAALPCTAIVKNGPGLPMAVFMAVDKYVHKWAEKPG